MTAEHRFQIVNKRRRFQRWLSAGKLPPPEFPSKLNAWWELVTIRSWTSAAGSSVPRLEHGKPGDAPE